MNATESIHCAFCDKVSHHVDIMVVGKYPPAGCPVAICNECIDLCNQAVQERKHERNLS